MQTLEHKVAPLAEGQAFFTESSEGGKRAVDSKYPLLG